MRHKSKERWQSGRMRPPRPPEAGPPLAEKRVKMPCAYILWSQSTQKHYIGSSRENIADSRVNGHNSGKARSTRLGRPWKLIYQEQLPSYTEARKRENFLKSGQGRKWIEESLS